MGVEEIIEDIIYEKKEEKDLNLNEIFNEICSLEERYKKEKDYSIMNNNIERSISKLTDMEIIALFNKLRTRIRNQEDKYGFASPITAAYYEYMFYIVPNAETIGKTKTHNK